MKNTNLRSSQIFITPDRFFLFIALISGVVFLLLTPPFQSPDEINHFYKAYHISEGNLLAENQNERLGGHIPESLVKLSQPFKRLRWYSEEKTSADQIHKAFNIQLNEKQKTFADFPNTAVYSPVSYTPQVISIYILRKFHVTPLFIFYGARLFTLLTWILGIWLSIRIIPFYKWLFVLLALLPMSIFINMSVSADVITNLLVFLIIALVIKAAFQDQKVGWKTFIPIMLISICLASAKLVYTPVVLLVWLIPKSQFQNVRSYFSLNAFLMIITFSIALIWSQQINSQYLPYSAYNPAYRDHVTIMACADVHAQKEYILNHGFYIVEVFIKSLFESSEMYLRGYIGTFGWLDTKLPWSVIILSYIVIILVAVLEDTRKYRIMLWQKAIMLVSLFACISLILLSQHLIWDCVGGDLIQNIQGRYLIPAFPLLWLLFNNSTFKKQNLTATMVMCYSIVLLTFSAWTLYGRYYN